MAADNRNFVNKFANEGGGDVLVEDKRMEELKSATAKTGSQISTSAQYIPLQDIDGNLVKIAPASMEEAVRNVLGSLLANNDKGTTISGIPALSGSGGSLDFGSVTPANLASVLGARQQKTIRLGPGETYIFRELSYSVFSIYEQFTHGLVGVYATGWSFITCISGNEVSLNSYYTLSMDAATGFLTMTSTASSSEEYEISVIDSTKPIGDDPFS